MWLAQRMISAEKQKPAAEVAQVTGQTQMQGTNTYRGVSLAAPWGIAYCPPDSARTVVVNTGAGMACVGTIAESRNLRPGELLLYSGGGAEIYLKNTGEVVINGQIFAAKKGD